MSTEHREDQVPLTYLLLLFLKVGSISFGGFMALIAVLQKEIVEKDNKIKDHVLLDAVSLASVLPGPVAVNSVGYVGYYLRGFWGAIISMAAVVLPSFLLVLGLSMVYFKYGEIENIQTLISYVMPAIIVIILTVGISMSRKHVSSWEQYVIGIVALLILQLVGGIAATLAVIVAGGIFGYFYYSSKENAGTSELRINKGLPRPLIQGIIIITAFLAIIFILMYFIIGEELMQVNLQVFLTFTGMSLSLFGGGYVFIPIIQETVVTNLSWLTSNEFNTAIALSQITPGPILISAAFIGYKVAGITGATLATIGIFLPSGLLIIASSNYLHQVSDSYQIKAIFKGLRPAIIGLIFSAGITIALEELTNPILLTSFVITAILALRFKLSTIWIMLASIILGLLGSLIL